MTNARNLADVGRIEGLSLDNVIINGNFDIWQRGTSFSSPGYGADRWQTFRLGSSITQSREAFALGQTDVPGEPEYFARTVVSSVAGAGNAALLQQQIEGVRTFAGQTATLSFWAKADAAKNIALEFFQGFGTGGLPSSNVSAIGVTTLALTATWQKFSVTAAIPSISGKTIGTDDNDRLQVAFWFDAGSDFNARTNSLGQQSGTFDIAQVKLEPGSVATPFRSRPISQELALCQWYYRIVPQSAAIGTSTSTTAGLVKYFHKMRKDPTRALIGGSTLTIDFFGVGQSTTTSFVLFGSEDFTAINFNSASPARTAFIPVSVLNDISLDAEL